ncbi:MAG: sigma-54-dependent Fis family transcriptional regulator [Deltaproteobacteria bacterium]|nr:sigma-54-dependent Fis family transcriptional regulator [Deltaproteobacteria bacterium]
MVLEGESSRGAEPPTLMVVDDEPNALFTVSKILEDHGYRVVQALGGRRALRKLKRKRCNVVIADERMPDLSGMELFRRIKAMDETIPVIILTAYGSVDFAVQALREGIYYFFEKPIFSNLERFLAIIKQATKTEALERELNALRREKSEGMEFPGIIGKSRKMREVLEMVRMVAPTDKTVLIQGESGTGKELIARAIHKLSPRRGKPMVAVSCGALSDDLLTSELFGHVKGAFTGAVDDQKGRFETAHGGTLFLDEIAEVPLQLQRRLLRVLQEKEFEKVGSSRTIKTDVRIISATQTNLHEEVTKGNFRDDLYYRLSVVPIMIPPLRERTDDIPLLLGHFLTKHQERGERYRVLPEVVEKLQAYRWPGNVRELENVVQQMMIFCQSRTIRLRDLPPHILVNRKDASETGETISLPRLVSELEESYILQALSKTDWHLGETARQLGMTRKMLGDRIRKYQLDRLRKR